MIDDEHKIRMEASAFVETEAVVEQAAQGRKRRPQRAGDQGSMTDGGLIEGTCVAM
jgi:hypothetical protein